LNLKLIRKDYLPRQYRPAVILIAALVLGGGMLMLQGNDAVTLAASEKNCLLTADTVNASFQGIGGRVVGIEVDEQQDVKAGDVIMQLDTTDIDLQIAQLEVSIAQQDIKIEQARIQTVRPEELDKQKLTVASAKETYKQAQQNYDRCQILHQEGGMSKKDFDNAASQLEIAKNTLALQQAQAEKLAAQYGTDSLNYEYSQDLLALQRENLASQLKTLRLQKERMTLKAPIDGKITKLIPKTGENIAAGATAAIIQTNSLYYSLYVDEKQVMRFEKGDTVIGTVTALKKEIEGTVRSIGSAPQYASLRMSREKGQPDTNAYVIVVDVKPSSKLLPGMTVEVDIDE